jgi:hypothetical protein
VEEGNGVEEGTEVWASFVVSEDVGFSLMDYGVSFLSEEFGVQIGFFWRT